MKKGEPLVLAKIKITREKNPSTKHIHPWVMRVEKEGIVWHQNHIYVEEVYQCIRNFVWGEIPNFDEHFWCLKSYTDKAMDQHQWKLSISELSKLMETVRFPERDNPSQTPTDSCDGYSPLVIVTTRFSRETDHPLMWKDHRRICDQHLCFSSVDLPKSLMLTVAHS